MGKLTYINRKIDGSKLSQVVVRDITKRIYPNVSFKTALRDPIVEFDISSKSIDDDGLESISQALVVAIQQTIPGRALILEEVSLKNNKFSAAGLVAFATVVQACSAEMRNLDLSDNLIEIRTSKDALSWEMFLQSFTRCTSLRRLDLSGNNLGQKGFEILSKVWAAEEGVIVCEKTGTARICGLQSIPYVCLASTGLNDLGSSYLSYILESHKFVHELLPLVPQARPGSQSHQLQDLDEVEGCNGIIWKPNASLSSLGGRVLELAEVLRKKGNDLQDQDISTTGAQLVQATNELEISDASQSATEKHSRRDSISIMSIDDSFHIDSSNIAGNISRARSRILLEALRNGGPTQNELWTSALKMLRYTRIILPQQRVVDPSLDLSSYASTLLADGSKFQQSQPHFWHSSSSIATKPHTRTPNSDVIQSETSGRPALRTGNPNASLSLKKFTTKDKQKATFPKSKNSSTRVKHHKTRNVIEELSKGVKQQYDSLYRTELPAGFNQAIWTEIIAYAADAHGVVRDSQRTSVVKWGANRESMAIFQNMRGKHESQQAYKALEAHEF